MWILLLTVAELKQNTPDEFPQLVVCSERKNEFFFFVFSEEGSQEQVGR